MATQNQSIVTLYKSLCAQQDSVSAKIQTTTDPKILDALSGENHEIMHRLVMAQNLLFQADSAQLKDNVKDVVTAAGQLQAGLAQIQSVTDVVNCVTQYLTAVDEAIDLAKTLVAA